MMLRYSFDAADDADLIDSAVQDTLAGGLRTADIMQDDKTAATTDAMGDAVLAALDARAA